MNQPETKPTPRMNRTIQVIFDQVEYIQKIYDPTYFRFTLDLFIEHYPELVPPEILDRMVSNGVFEWREWGRANANGVGPRIIF